MILSKCPRCGQRAYEKIKTHGHCIECNFNSVEGFLWGDKNGRIARDLYNNKKEFQNHQGFRDESESDLDGVDHEID